MLKFTRWRKGMTASITHKPGGRTAIKHAKLIANPYLDSNTGRWVVRVDKLSIPVAIDRLKIEYEQMKLDLPPTTGGSAVDPE